MKSHTLKILAGVTLLIGSAMAYAEGSKNFVPNHPKWKEECGGCHIAYPPQFLNSDNWTKMMSGLDKHFGANATLDSKDNKDILNFLQRNAGTGDRYGSSTLRISDSAWFKREHDEVPARAWTSPEVKSPSNCAACHVNAEQGNWSENGIHMPKGMRMEEEE